MASKGKGLILGEENPVCYELKKQAAHPYLRFLGVPLFCMSWKPAFKEQVVEKENKILNE